MTGWRRVAATAAGGVVAGTAGTAAAVAIGAAYWNGETARVVERLASEAPVRYAAAGTRFSLTQLDGLPAPVARYFAFALTPGAPLARRATVRHEGEFAITPDAWHPFASVEHFAAGPPGFVWDARIRVAPLVTVRVRDSYLDGEGAMIARAAAIVPIANERGTQAMAEASLQRYLAEAPWLPTALLPSAGVAWMALDDSTARATLTDRGVTVSVDFHFGAGGEIVRTSAVRNRDVGGTSVPTLWVGAHHDYRRVHGMMVPREGEVGWVLPDRSWLPYWRGRIVDVEYDVAAAP